LVDDLVEGFHILFGEVIDGFALREKLSQLLVHLFDIRFLSRIEGVTIEEMRSHLLGKKRSLQLIELGETEVAIR
jgi:hypothetical protein